MPDNPQPARTVTLSLPREKQWTLHHVLLDRIEQEAGTEDPARVDPPPVEVFQAFETLDAGDTTFTVAQLEAIQAELASYHHAPTWILERALLEQLLHHVTELLDRQQDALAAEG